MKTSMCVLLLVPMLAGCKLTRTQNDAPFRLGRLVGQVWATDPDNTDESREAILVLSNAELPCADLTQNMYRELDNAIGEGQGVLFILDQDRWDEEGEGSLSWEGLWMAGYGYSTEDGDRGMQSLSFSDGFVYYDFASYYGLAGGVWLQIDEAGADGVSGSFSTTYWSGSFSAQDCGAWEEPIDTWDSWWGDDSW